MFHSLKTILPHILKKNKISSEVEAILICAETNKIIKDILGEPLVEKAKAVYVRDKNIAIEASSSQVASQLKLYEQAIVETVQAKFPQRQIEQLWFIKSFL
jgi:hypothetical protein